MNKLIDFLQKERLYILILIFVLLFNAIAFFQSGQQSRHKAKESVAGALSAEESKVKKFEDDLIRRQEMVKIIKGNERLLVLFALATLLVLALILLGIIIDAFLLSSALAKKSPDIRTYAPGMAMWGILDIIKVILLFLFFGYILVISEAFLSLVFPILKSDNFRMIINSSILDTTTVILIIYFSAIEYKEKLAELGINFKNFLRNIFYGVVGYIALIPVLIAIVAVTAFVINITKYVPAKQPVVELFLREKDTVFLTYASLFAAIVGPIIEELFFRGFMYGALKKYIGVFWSIMLTAAIFAALHTHPVGFLPIMALGCLLAYLYERTGTLVSSITVHMTHNLCMVFLVFLVKQIGIL